MNSLHTLDDLDRRQLHGARVLLRVDFNVPLADGKVMDSTRLEAALPTIRELRAAGARVVMISHCGRPKGQPDPRYSLRPVAERLGELLAAPVAFAEDCIGDPARQAIDRLGPGDACLLENLRFHSGETAGDGEFAAHLAALAEVYVGDAFGTAHRAHASIVGAAERLPRRAAGRLMVREIESLSRLLGEPEAPFVGVLGGAKIGGKMDTLHNLLPRLDALLLGGGMANTFLVACGLNLAASLVERDALDLANEILALADEVDTRVELPTDLVVTDDLENPQRIETVPAGGVPGGMVAVDIGEATRKRYAGECVAAATLFWNGPLGVFEKPPFDAGTRAVAESLVESGGFTVIGGGETVAAARRAGLTSGLSHVSTGGGASLALLAGKTLPGVAVLEAGS